MTFEQLEYHGEVYKFKSPLALESQFDESQQLFVVKNEELTIYAYSQTIEQLENELAEQIHFLWIEYAKEDDKNLTPDAINLKTKLLKYIKKEKNEKI